MPRPTPPIASSVRLSLACRGWRPGAGSDETIWKDLGNGAAVSRSSASRLGAGPLFAEGANSASNMDSRISSPLGDWSNAHTPINYQHDGINTISTRLTHSPPSTQPCLPAARSRSSQWAVRLASHTSDLPFGQIYGPWPVPQTPLPRSSSMPNRSSEASALTSCASFDGPFAVGPCSRRPLPLRTSYPARSGVRSELPAAAYSSTPTSMISTAHPR